MNIGKGGSDQLKNNAVERFVGDKIILVAGGAGFVGSHLCGRLVEEEHRKWDYTTRSCGCQITQ